MPARTGPIVGLYGPGEDLIPFWPLDPRPEDIHVCSIAHGLGSEARYGGHTRSRGVSHAAWWVADHAVECSYAPMPDGCDPSPEEAFERLNHDNSEGLGLRDLPNPLKRAPEMGLGQYLGAEHGVMSAVAVRFGMRPEFWELPHVKWADRLVFRTEVRDLRQREPWVPVETAGPTLEWTLRPGSAIAAERRWLTRFVELCEKTGRGVLAEEGRMALARVPEDPMAALLRWVQETESRWRIAGRESPTNGVKWTAYADAYESMMKKMRGWR